MTLRIAVDAMGGDDAPDVAVEGALAFAAENPEVTVVLCGREEELKRLVGDNPPPSIQIRHAEQVVGMGESPVLAVREKKDSSIAVAVRMVKDGEADAVLSAGNTGVVVSQATLGLKRLKGVKRPGIMVLRTHGGGPGRLITPELKNVRAEVDRADRLVKGLKGAAPIQLIASGDGSGPAAWASGAGSGAGLGG